MAVLDSPQAAAKAVSCCLWYCATGMGFFQKVQPSSPAFYTAFPGPSTKQHCVYRTNYLCCVPPAWIGKETITGIVCFGADATLVWMTVQLLSWPDSYLWTSRKTQTILPLECNSHVCEYVGEPSLSHVGVFWMGTITFWPSTSHVNSSLLGLVFKCLRKVSAKLPTVPCVWNRASWGLSLQRE